VAWGLGHLADVACLLVTELVSNMVRHAPSASELTIRQQGGAVRIGVTDDDPHPPVLQYRPPLAESGRGLALVDALASAWGSHAVAGRPGKVVWFELPAVPGADHHGGPLTP